MRAIIYTRVSSIGERQSNDRQVEDLTKYASLNNMEVCEVFNEKISGGVSNDKRDVLNAAYDYALSNGIDIILTSELSRVGRAIWQVLEFVKRCADAHLNIFFQKEGLRLLNAAGEVDSIMAIYISCLGFCAEKERENIAFRLNSGRKLAIEKGVKMGRKVGSVKTKEAKEKQYEILIKYLRKYDIETAVVMANQKGCKCGMSTAKTIKREFAIKKGA
jgi:DNA invertase Pin-like site-specific DNA recombinase